MKLINAYDLKLYIMRHLLIDGDSTTEEIERQILRAIDVQPELAYCPNCGAKMDEEVSAWSGIKSSQPSTRKAH